MEQLQRNVLTLHLNKLKNTSAFDLRSSSGVRGGLENFFFLKEEKKQIDKKQNNFQNLNVKK